MSHMKQVSLRELHEKTGDLIRDARRLGGLIVTDRGAPIARIEPVDARPAPNPFRSRKVLSAYRRLFRSGRLGRGTDSTRIVSEGREAPTESGIPHDRSPGPNSMPDASRFRARLGGAVRGYPSREEATAQRLARMCTAVMAPETRRPVTSPEPVLDPERRHSFELSDVVGDAHRAQGSRVRRDEHVVRPDGGALLLEGHSDSRVEAFSVRFQRSNRQRAKYRLDLLRQPTAAALGCTVAQFAGHDHARQDVGLANVRDPLCDKSLRLSDEMRQDVRVEQVQARHVRVRSAPVPGARSAGAPHQAA